MEVAANFAIIVGLGGALALILAFIYKVLVLILRLFGFEVHE